MVAGQQFFRKTICPRSNYECKTGGASAILIAAQANPPTRHPCIDERRSRLRLRGARVLVLDVYLYAKFSCSLCGRPVRRDNDGDCGADSAPRSQLVQHSWHHDRVIVVARIWSRCCWFIRSQFGALICSLFNRVVDVWFCSPTGFYLLVGDVMSLVDKIPETEVIAYHLLHMFTL